MKLHRIMAIMAIMAMLQAACSGAPRKTKTEAISIVPNRTPYLGAGVNSATGAVTQSCVELEELTDDFQGANGSEAEFRLLEIKSTEEMRKELQVTASRSLGARVYGGSGKTSYVSNIGLSANSRYLMVRTRVANSGQVSRQATFTPDVQRLIRMYGGDSKEFIRACGDGYVNEVLTGGEFVAIFKFTITTSEEEEKFSAAMSGAGVGWQAKGKINYELEKFKSLSRTEVMMYKAGTNGAFPTVEGIQDFGLKFPEMVNTTGGRPVVIEARSESYNSVGPRDITTNPEAIAVQRRVVDQIAQRVEKAYSLSTSILDVKNYRSAFEAADDTQLNEWDSQIGAYLNTMQEAAKDCFEDLWNSCKLPTDPFPTINLPKRKVGPSGPYFAVGKWKVFVPQYIFNGGMRQLGNFPDTYVTNTRFAVPDRTRNGQTVTFSLLLDAVDCAEMVGIGFMSTQYSWEGLRPRSGSVFLAEGADKCGDEVSYCSLHTVVIPDQAKTQCLKIGLKSEKMPNYLPFRGNSDAATNALIEIIRNVQ